MAPNFTDPRIAEVLCRVSTHLLRKFGYIVSYIVLVSYLFNISLLRIGLAVDFADFYLSCF